jgi:hypothetical protein
MPVTAEKLFLELPPIVQVKVSDFGLSRALGVEKDYYQSQLSSNLKLPIAW